MKLKHRHLDFRSTPLWSALRSVMNLYQWAKAEECSAAARYYWSNQDVLFNFHADIAGIGSLPICM